MMPSMRTAGLRAAFRVEGDFWNAYCALEGTMEGAVLLGSIRMNAIMADAKRKKQFMDLMAGLVGDFIKSVTGSDVTIPEAVPAPESERSGNA